MGKNLLVAAVVAISLPGAVLAQELPTATKYENATWANAVDIQYEMGERDAALAIVYEHFLPLTEGIGWDVLVLEYETGDWDARYVFELVDGPAQLEWGVSPIAESWWAAFAESEGGAEAALALYGEYADKVARTRSNIIMQRHAGNHHTE